LLLQLGQLVFELLNRLDRFARALLVGQCFLFAGFLVVRMKREAGELDLAPLKLSTSRTDTASYLPPEGLTMGRLVPGSFSVRYSLSRSKP
jgi:hypothetical protein